MKFHEKVKTLGFWLRLLPLITGIALVESAISELLRFREDAEKYLAALEPILSRVAQEGDTTRLWVEVDGSVGQEERIERYNEASKLRSDLFFARRFEPEGDLLSLQIRFWSGLALLVLGGALSMEKKPKTPIDPDWKPEVLRERKPREKPVEFRFEN